MIYSENYDSKNLEETANSGTMDGKKSNINSSVLELFNFGPSCSGSVLYYVYGVLSSSYYCNEYSGALFLGANPNCPPRIPIFSDRCTRVKISQFGHEIAQCENSHYKPPIYSGLRLDTFLDGEEFRLTKYSIDLDTLSLELFEDRQLRIRVIGIVRDALLLRISGYNVLEKWLRERKYGYYRRTFRSDDIDELRNLLYRIIHQIQLLERLDLLIQSQLEGSDIKIISPNYDLSDESMK